MICFIATRVLLCSLVLKAVKNDIINLYDVIYLFIFLFICEMTC